MLPQRVGDLPPRAFGDVAAAEVGNGEAQDRGCSDCGINLETIAQHDHEIGLEIGGQCDGLLGRATAGGFGIRLVGFIIDWANQHTRIFVWDEDPGRTVVS